jgi:sugar transferase (PEP-CTERM system associated)
VNITMPTISRRQFVLIATENVLLLSACVIGAHARLGERATVALLSANGALGVGLVVGICQLCLYYQDLYDPRVFAVPRDVAFRTLNAFGVNALLLAALYGCFPGLNLEQGVYFYTLALLAAVVVSCRMAFRWGSRTATPDHRILIVGTNQPALRLARELFDRREELGVEIVGFIDPDPARIGAPVINPRVIGSIPDIPAIVRSRSVDRVVLGLADERGKLPMEQLLAMRVEGIRFEHLASVYEAFTGKIAVENLRPSWLIFSSGFRKSRFVIATKRLGDVVLAGSGLLLASPLLAVAALATRATSPGPVLFHQQRVGQHGRVFTVHKLRSMRVDAEVGTGAVWASREDPRTTAVGGLLRRTRIDEIPQLWNVLVGEMSLVGPRPERPEFVADLVRQIPFYDQRHVVKPGVTGWAQVRYGYGACVADALEKLQYDLYYIKNMSLAFDMFVVFETAKTVLLGRGSR